MTHTAKITSTNRLLATALTALVVAISGTSHAQDNVKPPAQARAMTGVELYVLYGDRSWQWTNGAGRMETKGRRFTAVAGSGDGASWAEGRWVVTNRGRLCLRAKWHAASGSYPSTTCFAHVFHDNTIYQRKEPSGDWYVFKHFAPKPDDEFNKLVEQDLVSSEIQDMRLRTAAK